MNSSIIAFTDPRDGGAYYLIDFDVVRAEEHTISAQVSSHPIAEGADITDHVRPELKRLSMRVRVTNSPINNVTFGLSPGALPGVRSQLVLETTGTKHSKDFQVTGGSAPLFTTGPVQIAAVNALIPVTYTPPVAKPGSQEAVLNTISWSYLKMPENLDRVTRVFQTFAHLCQQGVPVEVSTDLMHYPRMLITSVSAPRDGTTGVDISLDFQELRTASVQRTELTIKAKPKQKRAEPKKNDGKKATPFDLGGRKNSVASQTIDWFLDVERD